METLRAARVVMVMHRAGVLDRAGMAMRRVVPVNVVSANPMGSAVNAVNESLTASVRVVRRVRVLVDRAVMVMRRVGVLDRGGMAMRRVVPVNVVSANRMWSAVNAVSASRTASVRAVRRVRVPVVRGVMVTPPVGVLVRVVKVMRHAVPVSAANASHTASAANASLTVSVRDVRRVRVPVVRGVMVTPRVVGQVRVVMVTPPVGVLVRVVMIVVPAVRSAKNVLSVR